jgi:hypothetical protein
MIIRGVTYLDILFIGDIVGRPGRKAVKGVLNDLKSNYKIDFVIANGENAAGGTGLTKKVAIELFNMGIDCLTMGNHVWDKKEIFDFINEEHRIVRPGNYPEGTPGCGSTILLKNNKKIGIINVSGRVFMDTLDCPFKTVERELINIKKHTNIIIVDFHAEATSEKVAMAWFLDGKVTAVLGTHTHVQTADERILPRDTAYITDVGMTGPYNSVLGIKADLVLKKFITQLPVSFKLAAGDKIFNGVVLNVDDKTGKAREIKRINLLIKSDEEKE